MCQSVSFVLVVVAEFQWLNYNNRADEVYASAVDICGFNNCLFSSLHDIRDSRSV